MEKFLSYIPIPDMVVLLCASAILGMIYAYWQKWAWSKETGGSLRIYLFGDGKAVARSFTKLVGALGVTIIANMTAGMDVMGVIILGGGIGLAVPEQVTKQEKENNGTINAQLVEEDGTRRQGNSGPDN